MSYPPKAFNRIKGKPVERRFAAPKPFAVVCSGAGDMCIASRRPITGVSS